MTDGTEAPGFSGYDFVQDSTDEVQQAKDTALFDGSKLTAAREHVPGFAALEREALAHVAEHLCACGRQPITVMSDALHACTRNEEPLTAPRNFATHLHTWSSNGTGLRKPAFTVVIKISEGAGSRMQVIGAEPFAYPAEAGAAALFPSLWLRARLSTGS